MHTQQRSNQQPAPATKQTPVTTKPGAVRSAPAVLDDRALRQVSGAGQEGPYKGW